MTGRSNIHFTRQPNGNYRFETTEGKTFEARKTNNGQAWEIYEITWAPFADGKYHEMTTRRDGVWSSRIEAASAAFWFDRTADDFWDAYNRADVLVLRTR